MPNLLVGPCVMSCESMKTSISDKKDILFAERARAPFIETIFVISLKKTTTTTTKKRGSQLLSNQATHPSTIVLNMKFINPVIIAATTQLAAASMITTAESSMSSATRDHFRDLQMKIDAITADHQAKSRTLLDTVFAVAKETQEDALEAALDHNAVQESYEDLASNLLKK